MNLRKFLSVFARSGILILYNFSFLILFCLLVMWWRWNCVVVLLDKLIVLKFNVFICCIVFWMFFKLEILIEYSTRAFVFCTRYLNFEILIFSMVFINCLNLLFFLGMIFKSVVFFLFFWFVILEIMWRWLKFMFVFDVTAMILSVTSCVW